MSYLGSDSIAPPFALFSLPSLSSRQPCYHMPHAVAPITLRNKPKLSTAFNLPLLLPLHAQHQAPATRPLGSSCPMPPSQSQCTCCPVCWSDVPQIFSAWSHSPCLACLILGTWQLLTKCPPNVQGQRQNRAGCRQECCVTTRWRCRHIPRP